MAIYSSSSEAQFSNVEHENNNINSKPVSMKDVWIRTVLLFLTSLLIITSMIILSEKTNYEAQKQEALYYSAEQGQQIQRQLNQAFSAIYVVAAAFKMENTDFEKITEFDSFAKNLLPLYDSVSSIQLAPDAIVSKIYPLEGNEKAIGHNLLKDKNRMADVKKAIETKNLTLSGPYNMIQGGKSIIGRLPVFVKDDSVKGDERFWGLVISTVRFETIMSYTSLQDSDNSKYNYELSSLSDNPGNPVIFSSSLKTKLDETGDFIFDVPNGKWMLSVKPKEGWINYPLVCLKLLGAAIISYIIAFGGYNIFRKPILLQSMVEERTIDLAKANDDLKLSQDKLYHMAHHDILTDLPNRAMLEMRFMEALEEAKLNSKHVALLCIDLDFFKPINDTWGHSIGDEVLKQVAERMKECVRKTDTVGRMGGDEFSVLLPNLDDISFVNRIMEEIDKAVKMPFMVGELELTLSASVGGAIYPKDGEDLNELTNYADRNMYIVKDKRKRDAEPS